MIINLPTLSGAPLAIPEAFTRLYDLANNLWWSWDDEARAMWARIDTRRWRETLNPISLLQGVEPQTWETLNLDPAFVDLYESVVRRFDRYMTNNDAWYDREAKEHLPGPVAYLCTEYGLSAQLPFYSGGLGVLAGDHLKTTSDLGIPMVAVGLLYGRGYFRQAIDPDGDQQHYYPRLDLSRRPIHPIADRSGGALRVQLNFPGRVVHVGAWQLQVGRVPLILLDTNLPENHPADRPITHLLYVRGRDMRLAQELVLGIGAVKVITALGLEPAVWHVNEGHAAFSLIERATSLMDEHGFDGAAAEVRAKTMFTLHTPVPAGNEKFELSEVQRYMDYLFPDLPAETVATVGRAHEHEAGVFDMGALAIRMASFVNGVSQRHGEVASHQWGHLVGGKVVGITNGVHVPTWMGNSTLRLVSSSVGADWSEKLFDSAPWASLRDVVDDDLWHAHVAQKELLLRSVRAQLVNQFGRHGAGPDLLREVEEMLPPERLTIGFARRFATYKRATLILRDLPRLQALLTNADRPVQILFSGKAHPADQEGQDLIKRVVELSNRPEFRGHLFFVEDYDMDLGRLLTSGCDVWLNNPVPPKEASGTSGMKAALNGCVNVSIPDGWWGEAVRNAENGWSFGPADLHPESDDSDAGALYHLLESEIVPLFYDRDPDGLPKGWIQMMKESMATCTQPFSSHRMVIDYANLGYLPIGTGGT